MTADQRKWDAVPAAATERRTDSLRREAYEQRDRSKRLGMALSSPKAHSKLDTLEPSSSRFI